MQVAILIWIFRRRFTDFPMAEPLYAALKALVATTVMGVAVYGMDRAALADERAVIRLIGMVLVGAGAFLSTAWLMKSSELRELMKR
jgi:quinol-cytochrome oxidoreductase complex cytochrome b subunit